MKFDGTCIVCNENLFHGSEIVTFPRTSDDFHQNLNSKQNGVQETGGVLKNLLIIAKIEFF